MLHMQHGRYRGWYCQIYGKVVPRGNAKIRQRDKIWQRSIGRTGGIYNVQIQCETSTQSNTTTQ